jgi:hypothetical protein
MGHDIRPDQAAIAREGRYHDKPTVIEFVVDRPRGQVRGKFLEIRHCQQPVCGLDKEISSDILRWLRARHCGTHKNP